MQLLIHVIVVPFSPLPEVSVLGSKLDGHSSDHPLKNPVQVRDPKLVIVKHFEMYV